MSVSIQEYEALLKLAEDDIAQWKDRFVAISESSLRRADLLHKIVEIVKGHSVEEGTYNEKDIPRMVRQEIMDAAAAVGRKR